ncbi:WYL domain-containing protein [Enterococcus sp. 669A]|uniref:WYL domain-containing protein n=1 Tax=Candidatus Enterococcus moelleringii TaxID=2815325 RepID=A0ABS3L582_9ENTE|nr:WYL domain-containing protein [Enterococcus sp. 669A]MBO1304776.1 WYL domain-containing protein [Enterococcus sp. 669A]
MQIIRLLQTTLILLNRKKVTAKELAERFEVTPRTIYRDVDVLSLAGIPVYSVKGRNGGIYLEESFQVDNTLMEQEQDDLLLALHLLQSIGLADTEKLMEKLGSVYDWSDWLSVDLSQEGSTSSETFLQLKQALFSEKEIQFTYYTEYGQTRLIKAAPKRILYKYQTWYLLAYQLDQEKWQLYPLQRVKQVVLGEKIHGTLPPEELDFPRIAVRLRFSKRIAYKRYDEFADLPLVDNPDSSFETTMEFAVFDDLYRFLLPLGKNVQILEPQWVKEKIVAYTQSFLENQL